MFVVVYLNLINYINYCELILNEKKWRVLDSAT